MTTAHEEGRADDDRARERAGPMTTAYEEGRAR